MQSNLAECCMSAMGPYRILAELSEWVEIGHKNSSGNDAPSELACRFTRK